MRIHRPGHEYIISDSKGDDFQNLKFVEKDEFNYEEGTTNEDLIEVLIDRLNFLNNKFPCKENGVALHHLQQAVQALNDRTEDRQRRGVEGKQIA